MLIDGKHKDLISKFYHTKELFDAESKLFENEKKNFQEEMIKLFSVKKIKEVKVKDNSIGRGSIISVKMSERSSVNFDIGKLKKLLSKSDFENIANATYTINDMKGLIAYLKECNADPVIFKSFIDTNIKIDQKKIDDLYDLGTIDKEIIKKCCNVTRGKPYFLVKKVEANHGESK